MGIVKVRAYLEKSKELLDRRETFVTISLVDIRGSAPQELGAKAIVTLTGLFFGTVGGGKIEAKAVAYALELITTHDLKSPNTRLMTWNLQRDVLMSCGGEVSLVFEITKLDQWKIAVFGAGHVAQALLNVLGTLECQVTCVDPRTEWLARGAIYPNVICCLATEKEPSKEWVKKFDQDTFFVVMTQGHATDVPILAEIFKTFPRAPFIGCLGSPLKAKKMKTELKAFGLDSNLVESLCSPIGLKLGNSTPSEIAVSVAAQLLSVRGNT